MIHGVHLYFYELLQNTSAAWTNRGISLRRQDRLNEEQAAWNANSCIFYLGHSSNKNICN